MTQLHGRKDEALLPGGGLGECSGTGVLRTPGTSCGCPGAVAVGDLQWEGAPSKESPGSLPAPGRSLGRGCCRGHALAAPARLSGGQGLPWGQHPEPTGAVTYFGTYVLLATLRLAASESQPLGAQDRVVLQGQRVLVQLPARPQRHTARPRCPAGMNWIEGTHQCCTPCPAGTFLRSSCSSRGNDSDCAPCPTGTFRAQPNTFRECQACYECDRHAFQSVLSNCSATSNIHCSEFSCRQCQPCTGRLIQRPCTQLQDTLCGTCKPDFYAEGGECRPCHTNAQETCGKECQRVCSSSGGRGSGLEYVLLALTGPLFLGALAIYHKRMEHGTGTARWSPQHWALLQEQPRGTAQPGGERDPSSPPEPRAALLQGSQLYAVIDAVPVRRWKEFMRVLELREAEIELVELEVAHIRDQQYEMLKRWCQQTSATLDRIFAALEHMDLGGCAEALRRSLPAGC
ncbi:tumor necrosis factor receptor superfamily, member 25 [Columba livia]|uniref:Tumor necrosis factor receptor superfamily, member 25 n=1 Tax=Columba livia TaxID=8932 RepID=A0A2I0LIN4_COLLI|nr:tumor necrosis factor receptor superfamily, member 25 [Columba livia]